MLHGRLLCLQRYFTSARYGSYRLISSNQERNRAFKSQIFLQLKTAELVDTIWRNDRFLIAGGPASAFECNLFHIATTSLREDIIDERRSLTGLRPEFREDIARESCYQTAARTRYNVLKKCGNFHGRCLGEKSTNVKRAAHSIRRLARRRAFVLVACRLVMTHVLHNVRSRRVLRALYC